MAQEVSVTDPIARAWQRMLLICFKPFDFKRWFLLGFCAWLAYLGEGSGGNGNFNFPTGGSGGRSAPAARFPTGISPGPELTFTPEPTPFDEVLSWIDAHLVLVIAGAILAFVLGLALFLLLQWLRARGEFMFVDGIASNRRDELVSRPWKQFARQANNYFIYQVALTLISSLIGLMIMAIGVWIAWADIRAWHFGSHAITGIITVLLLFPVPAIAMMLIFASNRMFIVPIMYVRGHLFMAAWGEFWRRIVPGHVGVILLFFLMSLVLNLAAGIATVLITCATCCIAALPYIGTVVLLPVLVFLRSYSLCFVEQFGSEYTMLSYVDSRPAFEVIMPPPQSPPPPPPPGNPGA